MTICCPDVKCSGEMEHWQHSIRYRCTACGRFFDFVLAPETKTPPPVPLRADRAKETQ